MGRRVIIGRKGRLHMPKIWGTDLISIISLTANDEYPFRDAKVYIAQCEKRNAPTTNTDHGKIYFNGKSDQNGEIRFKYRYLGDVPVIIRVRHDSMDFRYEAFSFLTPDGIVLPKAEDCDYPY